MASRYSPLSPEYSAGYPGSSKRIEEADEKYLSLFGSLKDRKPVSLSATINESCSSLSECNVYSNDLERNLNSLLIKSSEVNERMKIKKMLQNEKQQSSLEENEKEKRLLDEALVRLHEFDTKYTKLSQDLLEERLKSDNLAKLLNEKDEQNRILKQFLDIVKPQALKSTELQSELNSTKEELASMSLKLYELNKKNEESDRGFKEFKEKFYRLQVSNAGTTESLQMKAKHLQDALDTAQQDQKADRICLTAIEWKLEIISNEKKEMEESLSRSKMESDNLAKLLNEKDEQNQILKQLSHVDKQQALKIVELHSELDSIKKKLASTKQNLDEKEEKSDHEVKEHQKSYSRLKVQNTEIIKSLQVKAKALEVTLDIVQKDHTADRTNLAVVEKKLETALNKNKEMVESLSKLKTELLHSGLQNKKQFKCIWATSNLKEEELILYPNENGCVVDLLKEARKQVRLSESGSGVLRLLELRNHKIFNIQQEDTLLIHLNNAEAVSLRIEEIPKDELAVASDECLIPVAHFHKGILSTFGTSFLLKIRHKERFCKLKERIQRKLNVPNTEFEKFKFAIISVRRQKYVENKNVLINLSDFLPVYTKNKIQFRPWLGLDHVNNRAPTTRIN